MIFMPNRVTKLGRYLPQRAKYAIFQALYGSRLLCLPLRSFLKGGVPEIFFAHRVADIASLGPEGDFFGGIPAQVLDREKFIERLQKLKRLYHFVSLDEALAKGDGGRGGRLAALTFDDCYGEFLMVIQPILEELDIPGLYFITTGGLAQRELLWYDRLFSAILGAECSRVVLQSQGEKHFPLKNPEEKRAAAVALGQSLWQMEAGQRDAVISELVDQVGPGPLTPQGLYLSADDLAALARRPGVTLGSHTVTHPNLTLLTDEELMGELVESKVRLEEITGQEVRHLSYPNGLWNERVAAAAGKCGYRSACATSRGVRGNPFALPRVNVGWWSEAEFAVRTAWGLT